MSSPFHTRALLNAEQMNVMDGMDSMATSTPMDIGGGGSLDASHFDTANTQCGSVMSFDEMNMNSNDMAEDSFDHFAFPMQDSGLEQLGGDMSLMNMSPGSPMLNSPLIGGQDAGFDDFEEFLSANTHAHSAPWNPTNPRSDATTYPGSLQIPGQPKHAFMQSTLPNSYGGFSWADSGYDSLVAADTASLLSAPSAMMFAMDDTSETMEQRPTKRFKKTFVCDKPGKHKTREFPNIHDLERHQRSTHGIRPTHSQAHFFRCIIRGCRNGEKLWDRKDNFRSHIVRKHFGGRNDDKDKMDIDALVHRSRCLLTEGEISQNHRNKQAAKQASRQTAQKRHARRMSKLDSCAEEVGNFRAGLGMGPHDVTSSAASAVDGDYAFGPIDLDESATSFDSALGSPIKFDDCAYLPVALPAAGPTSAPMLTFNGGMSSPGDHDFW